MQKYHIEVKTDGRKYAGTDVHVYVQLIGSRAKSGELRLDNGEDNFEKNKLDRFDIQAECVGWLNQLRLFWRNPKDTDNPGWYPNYVEVTDTAAGVTWHVDVNRWLAEDEGDRRTDVTFDVPVMGLTTTDPKLRRYYMGFEIKHGVNQLPQKTRCTDAFEYSQSHRTTLDTSTARTTSGSGKVSSEWFGANFELSGSFSDAVTKSAGEVNQQDLKWSSTYDLELEPRQNITIVCVYYEYCRVGTARANGLSIEFAQVFSVQGDIFFFEGYLEEEQVKARLQAIIASATGISLTPDVRSKNARVVLAEKKLPDFGRPSLAAAASQFPARLVTEESLRVAPGARMLPAKAKSPQLVR